MGVTDDDSDRRAASSAAFAATVAPETGAPSLSDGTPASLESTHTMAAPLDGGLPPLPVVPAEHYKADREIARGGMGRIVAAADLRLGRSVALKELIDPVPEQRGRFQREALITARLQHPGIVPVYEAGRWPSGEPFFAMKLVSGRPLDKVIAEAATLEDRLALLPRVAAATEAMAYAHSQRVIHRDLKPANILIGEFGETVVIDWGLAKDLDATDAGDSANRAPRPRPADPRTSNNSTLTVAGAVMGTPAYMAPEQARGEPLDQRADVFALGAMLYHLLAGVPPYNARTASDVIAAAALGKVVPLTEREGGAPADLVAIVERAMAQLPVDRYADAGELAHELRRFLTGQLVSAHRYTTGQRIARFVRRHRAAVTIGAIAALGFAVGGTFAVRRILHERDVADHARSLADTRREAAEKLIDRMLSDVKDRLSQIGRLDLLANLGTEIRDYYGTLANIPGGMPADDVDRMAAAIDLIGLAERDSGKVDQAFKTWSDARERLATWVAGDSSPRTQLKRRIIARLDYELGTIHQQRGKLDAALAALDQARREFAALLVELPDDRLVLLGSAETHDRLGDLLRNDGKIQRAFEEYSEAKLERERAASKPSSRPSDEVLALSTSHVKLGSVYQARGESGPALTEYRTSLRLRETLLESQPDNVEVQERVLEVQLTLGDLQRQLGDAHAAIQTYQEALPVLDALNRRDPTNTSWRRLRGNIESDFGFALLDSGDFKGGLAQLDVAIETQRALVAQDPKSTTWEGDLSRSFTRAGDAELYLGETDAGIERYQHALEIRSELVDKEPKSAPYRRSVAWSYAKLASAYGIKGDTARALEAHEQALALRRQLVTEAPAQSSFRNELASTEIALGRMIAGTDGKRGKELIDAGLERARALVAGDMINNEWKETLIQGLLAEADGARLAGDATARENALEEALAVAQAAAERAPQNANTIPGFLAEAYAGLAEVSAARGDRAGAAAHWKAARTILEPLAHDHRLPAPRKALLDRAKGQGA